MYPEKLSPEKLIIKIQEEEKKFTEAIKGDKVFEETIKIRKTIKTLKEELVKLFPGRQEKLETKESE